MAWKFEFDAPVGLRHMRGFRSIIVMSQEKNMWWFVGPNRWVDVANDERPEVYEYSSSHHSDYEGAPTTFRAFKRYLNKRPELKGCEVVFIHYGQLVYPDKIVELNITATWEE